MPKCRRCETEIETGFCLDCTAEIGGGIAAEDNTTIKDLRRQIERLRAIVSTDVLLEELER